MGILVSFLSSKFPCAGVGFRSLFKWKEIRLLGSNDNQLTKKPPTFIRRQGWKGEVKFKISLTNNCIELLINFLANNTFLPKYTQTQVQAVIGSKFKKPPNKQRALKNTGEYQSWKQLHVFSISLHAD